MTEHRTGLITKLDHSVVHKICTGQVILNIASACKELIENSLDAGATAIDIRLVDSGLTSIEVGDNGCGIEKKEYGSITKAHCTSKLSDVTDLATLETFGFRGEALNALTALGKLTVTTRHASEQTADKIEFDHIGNLVKSNTCARTVGTTVLVEELFKHLPVRRKEFERNVKKEYHKLVQTVQAFCLISRNVRFSLTNKIKNELQTLVSTHANQTIKENICNVFGSKFLENLLEFVQAAPNQDQLAECNLAMEDVDNKFRITGFVSSPDKSAARSSGDRQFVYVNGRPCNFAKLLKVVNETYRLYNRSATAFPAVVLNLEAAKDSVDVNVTPDKREIFVEHEDALIFIVKISLINLYDSHNAVCRLQAAACKSSENAENVGVKRSAGMTLSSLATPPEERQQKIISDTSGVDIERPSNEPVAKQRKLTEIFQSNNQMKEEKRLSKPAQSSSGSGPVIPPSVVVVVERDIVGTVQEAQDNDQNLQDVVERTGSNSEPVRTVSDSVIVEESAEDKPAKCAKTLSDEPSSHFREFGSIKFSIDSLKQYFETTADESIREDNLLEDEEIFRARIDPGENEMAEFELRMHLKKTEFSRMIVIGQFNLGFIVALLDDNLFIIDQHASDEKYNFEMLQNTATLQSQKLISPLSLPLSVIHENIVMDRLSVFQKNGFEFIVDKEALCGQRLQLSAIPCCSGVTFDKGDVDEIIAIFEDDPTLVMYRPRKIRHVFASRACRKSVMIGKPLCKAEMTSILQNMAITSQPWHCPHGRPTVRHLISLP